MKTSPLDGLFLAPPGSVVYRLRPRSSLDLITQAWFLIGGVVVSAQAAQLDARVQWPFVVLFASWPALRVVHAVQERLQRRSGRPAQYL